jgi:hypothetical protein
MRVYQFRQFRIVQHDRKTSTSWNTYLATQRRDFLSSTKFWISSTFYQRFCRQEFLFQIEILAAK